MAGRRRCTHELEHRSISINQEYAGRQIRTGPDGPTMGAAVLGGSGSYQTGRAGEHVANLNYARAITASAVLPLTHTFFQVFPLAAQCGSIAATYASQEPCIVDLIKVRTKTASNAAVPGPLIPPRARVLSRRYNISPPFGNVSCLDRLYTLRPCDTCRVNAALCQVCLVHRRASHSRNLNPAVGGRCQFSTRGARSTIVRYAPGRWLHLLRQVHVRNTASVVADECTPGASRRTPKRGARARCPFSSWVGWRI